MRDNQPNEQLKIELLSQWKLEAESRNLIKISKLRTLIISSTFPTVSQHLDFVSHYFGPKRNFGKPVTAVIWTQSLATSAAFQF